MAVKTTLPIMARCTHTGPREKWVGQDSSLQVSALFLFLYVEVFGGI